MEKFKKVGVSIIGILLFIFVILPILSKVIKPLGEFLAWWFITKEEINAPITTTQAIIIDVATHFITYIAVGIIFGTIGWFDSDVMHYAYVVISELIALGLAILLRFILDYYWIIFVIIGIFFLTAIIIYLVHKNIEYKIESDEINATKIKKDSN